jgi:hypothetical protein
MKSINLLNTYELPETRKEEVRKLTTLLSLSSGDYGSYITLGVGDDPASSTVVLGAQVAKATKNAQNTVRGCMAVQSILDTFSSMPASYDQAQKLVKRDADPVVVHSTLNSTYVAIAIPGRREPCIVKGEEVLAAIENATRNG